MNLPWIKVFAALPRHRKALELAGAIGRRRAWTYVVELWLWASDQCPDGDLGHLADKSIADAAGWTGDPSRFVSGLRTAGFLDADGALHDWEDHQPAHVEAAAEKEPVEDKIARRKAKAALRQQRARDRVRSVTKRDGRDDGVTVRDGGRDDSVTGSVTKRDEDSLNAPAKTKTEILELDLKAIPQPPAGAELASSVTRKGRRRDRATTVVVPSADVAPVWQAFVAISPGQPVFTVDREDLIRKWLPIYGADRLVRCIQGYGKSDFHRQNKQIRLDLFLRNTEHIEAGLAKHDSASAPAGRSASTLAPLPERTINPHRPSFDRKPGVAP